jgi:hypothetical protein
MPIVWKKRFFRAWIAVALPLALLCAYLSVSSHYEAARAKGYAQEWHERDLDQERRGIPKGTLSQDPKDEMRASYRWMADAEAMRDRYAMYAALLVLLAPTGILASVIARWIWSGSKRNLDSGTPKSQGKYGGNEL